jgi:hypothetical protein
MCDRYFRVHAESKMFFRDYTEQFLPTIPTWEQLTKDGAVCIMFDQWVPE